MSNFTELGLIEMTRKRTRDSLGHILCEPCPLCGGRGEIKTARTVCYEILREILREWRQYHGIKSFCIIASQTVIDLFLEDEAAALVCFRILSALRCRFRWKAVTVLNNTTLRSVKR